MKSKTLLAALGILMIAFSACQLHAEYCTVRGTVQGVSDGAELELQDAWNQFKVIASTTVENGSFEFHPRISVPTHVYLYAKNPKDVYANPWDGGQLKDFILEPGTVSVQVNAEDVSDMSTGAAGTPLNETTGRSWQRMKMKKKLSGKKRSMMKKRIFWLCDMRTAIHAILPWRWRS